MEGEEAVRVAQKFNAEEMDIRVQPRSGRPEAVREAIEVNPATRICRLSAELKI